jgi:hypothetical protein
MRSAIIWQLLVTILLSLGATLLLWRLGPTAMLIVLFVLLLALFFFLTGLLRSLQFTRRRWGPGPSGQGGPGPDLSGVREPRRPRQPHWPPRAAAVDPGAE